MEEKEYLDGNTYLEDIWTLAAKVAKSKWHADVLIALWRGGAPVGVAMHEFFKASGIDIIHIPLKCFSYTGIESASQRVTFEFEDAVFSSLKPGSKVLVVDDVFDTGRTIAAVKERLEKIGAQMRSACVYWKVEKNETNILPDYYAKDIGTKWLVFPHEIDGLSNEEVLVKNPFLGKLLSEVKSND